MVQSSCLRPYMIVERWDEGKIRCRHVGEVTSWTLKAPMRRGPLARTLLALKLCDLPRTRTCAAACRGLASSYLPISGPRRDSDASSFVPAYTRNMLRSLSRTLHSSTGLLSPQLPSGFRAGGLRIPRRSYLASLTERRLSHADANHRHVVADDTINTLFNRRAVIPSPRNDIALILYGLAGTAFWSQYTSQSRMYLWSEEQLPQTLAEVKRTMEKHLIIKSSGTGGGLE
ncbi:hypothetical protein FA95DRAFT_413196 [Auriscalpium vulgare]|uniref:Uncharacterized protein n=1 Tax=Auriscalpium vulgare TaxID=40419 RepID=A0ACB8S3Q4_9AGAM|nr:hypothetical protein FA95DRAFT_413196 [Auriscalpium vulgare]